MPARPKPDANQSLPVWERPEPAPRPAPAPLSRDAIVRTAITIADEAGLDAVSLRKVGTALGAGFMRLYGYLSTKEELLDLMVDAVYAEMAASGAVAARGREAVVELAGRLRLAAHRHPWFADLLGGRPHQGPNALAYLEAWLAALGDMPGFDDVNLVMQAARTLHAYVLGAIQSEASEARAERLSGLTKTEWQALKGPYLQRMIETGRFPTIEKVVRDAEFPPADAVFAAGLQTVLDGVDGGIPSPLVGEGGAQA